MNDNGYLLMVIGVMTLATFFTRVLPFVALKNRAEHPLLVFLSRYTPAMIMMLLLIYSLKDIDLTHSPFGANELIALLVTSLLHLWKGNALVSIFSGTVFYMAALQVGFF